MITEMRISRMIVNVWWSQMMVMMWLMMTSTVMVRLMMRMFTEELHISEFGRDGDVTAMRVTLTLRSATIAFYESERE